MITLSTKQTTITKALSFCLNSTIPESNTKYRNPVGFLHFFIKSYARKKTCKSLRLTGLKNQDEADGIRTRDNLIKSQVLYRLSYSLAKQGQLDSNQRVQASKACALPLGDSPSISLLARVGNGIRIHDLQNHNLAR